MNVNFARLLAMVAFGVAALGVIDANALALTGVKSRKIHGAVTTFDLPIDTAQALAANVTVEPRAVGSGHKVVFQFDTTITVPGTVTVTDAAGPFGSATAPTITGATNTPVNNEVSVTLSGIPDKKRVTITLTGVNGSGTAAVSMGFLVGDVNNTRAVNATDISLVKERSGQSPAAGTFQFDLNETGLITAADISAAKKRSGLALETPGALTCGGTVRCVGVGKAYSTIQAAVTAAVAGDTVLVDDGTYAGFTTARSGTADNRIVIRAAGNSALINSANGRGEGITISNSSHVTIEGFRVAGMSAYGIAAHDASGTDPMRGLLVRNNIVSNSNSTNIYMSQVAESLIEGNETSGSVTSHGIYLANGGSDNTILRGNRTFSNSKNGIHLNGDESQSGDGLHTNVTIENNIAYSNAANGLDLDGIQDSLIRNNVFYGNGNSAIRAFLIDAAAGPKNLRIINNTVASSGGWGIKLTADEGGHVIFNNILFGTSGSIAVGSVTSAQSNNNVTNDKFSYDSDNSTVSLATWRSQTGEDAASLNSTTVVFKNTGINDYTLAAVSPARNAGTSTFATFNAPLLDVLGAARPNGAAFDIGAYETP